MLTLLHLSFLSIFVSNCLCSSFSANDHSKERDRAQSQWRAVIKPCIIQQQSASSADCVRGHFYQTCATVKPRARDEEMGHDDIIGWDTALLSRKWNANSSSVSQMFPERSNWLCTHWRGNAGRRGRSLCGPPGGASVGRRPPPVSQTDGKKKISWKIHDCAVQLLVELLNNSHSWK